MKHENEIAQWEKRFMHDKCTLPKGVEYDILCIGEIPQADPAVFAIAVILTAEKRGSARVLLNLNKWDYEKLCSWKGENDQWPSFAVEASELTRRN